MDRRGCDLRDLFPGYRLWSNLQEADKECKRDQDGLDDGLFAGVPAETVRDAADDEHECIRLPGHSGRNSAWLYLLRSVRGIDKEKDLPKERFVMFAAMIA